MDSDHRQSPGPGDVSRMDDFQVIAERQRVMTALAALTDYYRALNHEISGRDTLKWMLAR
jgi:hypothetical protein